MDIRMQTCIIIRKHGEYLVGKEYAGGGLKWSTSPYDAWRTRNVDRAREVALKTGGIMILFNPIVKQMKVM